MRALTLPDARRSLGRLSLAKERGGEGRIMAAHRAFGRGGECSGRRQALISHLAGFGILAVFQYLPLHLSPMGLRFGGRRGGIVLSRKIWRIASCAFRFALE
jgi:hypothetical protein